FSLVEIMEGIPNLRCGVPGCAGRFHPNLCLIRLKTSVQKGFTDGHCQVEYCGLILFILLGVRYHLCVTLVCTSIWLVQLAVPLFSVVGLCFLGSQKS
uniref:Uncharacterized protein n=1 Tax=Xenopus tropicalis TaxID=8364 RepID=A0A803KG77_XENTR